MIVSYEEQRRIDQKCLETDIKLMKEFLEKIQPVFDENFKLLSYEVNVRNPDSKGYKYNPDIKVHEINSAMIKDPVLGSESEITNAESNSVSAIYWKGYYLQEGYYTNENRTEEQKKLDKEKAMKLYKIAAYKNHHDAQLRYSHSLPRVKEYREEFLKYLTLAADNGNQVTMYTLAYMYLNGKVVQKDLKKGERYLKLSAACKNERAIAMDQKLA
ncbi:13017_t:CDS:2 [Cetraspora pellucida]|uniref:13017_t:CDS:1 n=1 Tax=Cetraspora pellucida TaxID=1433469 RepID=A0A9N9HZD1_9GLOM|nr:13017_t:CDS:2 [Cetraspora pellucida]